MQEDEKTQQLIGNNKSGEMAKKEANRRTRLFVGRRLRVSALSQQVFVTTIIASKSRLRFLTLPLCWWLVVMRLAAGGRQLAAGGTAAAKIRHAVCCQSHGLRTTRHSPHKVLNLPLSRMLSV